MVARKGFSHTIIEVVGSMRTEPFVFLLDYYPVLTGVAMSTVVAVYQAKDNPPIPKARTCTLRYQESAVVVGEAKVDSFVIKADCEGTVGLQVIVRVLLVFISGIGSSKRQKVLRG